jgi:hypothetical protein
VLAEFITTGMIATAWALPSACHNADTVARQHIADAVLISDPQTGRDKLPAECQNCLHCRLPFFLGQPSTFFGS